jgi:hypothetical protein
MMGLTRIVGRLGHIAATAVHSSPEISSHVARREDVKAITFWRNSSRGVPGDQSLLVAAIGLWVIDGDPISTVGPAVEDAGLRRGRFLIIPAASVWPTLRLRPRELRRSREFSLTRCGVQGRARQSCMNPTL